MLIFPAIDLYDGCAVRLLKGDYDNMTVYSRDPLEIALKFQEAGAEYIHMVDLEGAKEGTTPNIAVVESVVKNTDLKVEIGGGIRSMEVVEKYREIGVSRVILGTAAVENESFLKEAIAKYGDFIAVGADIKDGFVAIKGWIEKSNITCNDFFEYLSDLGVKTVICTDVSKDGAMQGTNRKLYKDLSTRFSMDIVASGGVSSIDDIIALRTLDLYAAIVGKAYYLGAIDLKTAIEVAK